MDKHLQSHNDLNIHLILPALEELSKRNVVRAFCNFAVAALAMYFFLLLDSPPANAALEFFVQRELIKPDLSWVPAAKWSLVLGAAAYFFISGAFVYLATREYNALKTLGVKDEY